MENTMLNSEHHSMNAFLHEVRSVLASRNLSENCGVFERTCEEIQVSIQMAASLSREYVTVSQEVFASALNIVSQQRRLDSDLMELTLLREKIEQQLSALKLSEERNFKILEVLRHLSDRLTIYKRENHAISEDTLKIIARLDKKRSMLDNETELTRELDKVSKQITRGEDPFAMKILTRLKRLEYHHAISQDVTAIHLVFSRILMSGSFYRQSSWKQMFFCFSRQPATKPQVIKLLARIVNIGSTLLREVKHLEEISRLMRVRHELMYREFMERQNKTSTLLWELHLIGAEINALEEKNDGLVGKIVKSRPRYNDLLQEVARIQPYARPYSKRVWRMHPELFHKEEIPQYSDDSDKAEDLLHAFDDPLEEVPKIEEDQPQGSLNLVSDVALDGEIPSPSPSSSDN